MKWPVIFENQSKLDSHIEENHPRQEGEDRLLKKAVAFQVELGEMAQEWRGFKFWSKDQKPRISKDVLGFHAAREGLTTKPLLEEFIDVVHFTASIGLELGIKDYAVSDYKKGSKNVLELVRDLFFASSFIGFNNDKFKMYDVLINHVDHLGVELGFTEEQLMAAYEEKNQTNHKRQVEGY